MAEENKKITREFGLSSFSLNNSTSVFILIFILVLFGAITYSTMPKEQFPEVVIPTVYINTPYPGNSPVDIENLITRPIEKELKSIKGMKKLNSTSAQDVSVIVIEFNENIDISKALQEVKDAVDKSKKELPTDLDNDPLVQEIDVSEVPIMIINISGDFEIDQLNDYAEWLEDELEELKEVSKVDISGSVDREIQINADLFKMDARKVTFSDIESAIANENISMSGGDILTDNFRRSLRVIAEFQDSKEIENIIVKSEGQNTIYLKDIAEVQDTYVERDSYARLATGEFTDKGNYPVISLQVVKRTGENLIEADQKINEMLEDAKGEHLPESLNIVITNNQADMMKLQLDNLENSIISGMILVILVLLFFMGLRNALFVGIAIPLSMFMSFLILGATGNTINMMVLFSLILALGMLVDNAIVIIENIYRLKEQGMTNIQAAKEGVGEVAIAIISSTLTTLAAFLPLAFWGGMIGEFMKVLPITLIIVLSSSLFVGLVINPVVAKAFMKVDNTKSQTADKKKKLTILALIMITLAIPSFFIFETYLVFSLLMFSAGITLLNAYFFRPASYWFQNTALTVLEKYYLETLRFALTGVRPILFFLGTIVILVFSLFFFGANLPEVVLFPDAEPNNVFVYADAPLGTDVEETNKITKEMEKKVFKVLEPYSGTVKSVVSNIGKGTSDPKKAMTGDGGGNVTPHKSKISVSFVDYQDRNGVSTSKIFKEIGEAVRTIPGIKVSTDKESMGPPVGAPISIEITGEDYLTLIEEAEKLKHEIDQSSIQGIEGLTLELETGKPELLVNIDRTKARRYGLSTGMLASTMRTAIYGKEVSKFKDGEDDYPIQLRLADKYRYDVASLYEQRLTYRDNKGKFHQVPVSSIADLEYSTTFGSVKRKDLDRLVTLSSNVIEGYNANSIVTQIQDLLEDYEMREGYEFKFAGEQEEQAESEAFLLRALMIAVCAIFMILVSQFNSVIKPFIIIGSVIFSFIGVFLGLSFFGDQFVIIMTGVGIISLAGVVVNNAIVLIDYIDLTRERKRKDMNLDENIHMDKETFIDCLVEGGYARLRPVLLTAITTVLGLVPLAVGFNIDFYGMFAHFQPNIYIGGQNASFWGPMAWTVIYGLVFATFLTLVIVPVMYLLTDRIIYRMKGMKKLKPQS
ncbi:efflux RND transporter permease subunit [Chondrinema litorale]|uniref:efflux RND transporter permease subunit n=1 Tax=Chondrinema litorale TaxID=2994555 RepID=UPI0025426DDC|nr:efflux RND transporter permease subunit [Chondrinema litorale]UZR95103.1 efflux RND transporter permease subunit [Chondrinema litorale]